MFNVKIPCYNHSAKKSKTCEVLKTSQVFFLSPEFSILLKIFKDVSEASKMLW
ncbi:Uncharacterized protein dnm_046120 [Desulfonema magnum]|uniref:Uncharacterized protein n=1 Tax=Desulfonema magnum TaxID=45655 RepID=A0A975BN79_9BACT|nr:Uncharacterized protein dnm_046120 [Desulfonema magnum]